jgi:cyanophycin synthetase
VDLALSLGARGALSRIRQQRAYERVRRASTYDEIWSDAAAEVGAAHTLRGDGVVELRMGPAAVTVRRHVTPLDDAASLALADDKTAIHGLLAEAGVVTPEHVAFAIDDIRPALDLMRSGSGPWVVKPVSASFGSGVTGNVATEPQLWRATWSAARHGKQMLLERQVRGDMYRLLFLDGLLLDVIRRRQPSVTGDGLHTIAELIARENRRRHEDQPSAPLLIADLDSVFALAAHGLTARSKPPAGTTVAVKTAVSQGSARDSETVREDVAPLVEAARRAAGCTSLRLAGVDIVTLDPTRSLAEAGGAVLEVNGNPGLHYHYEVVDPAAATRVAVPVVRALLSLSTDPP